MSSKYFIKLDIFDFFYLERGPPTGELSLAAHEVKNIFASAIRSSWFN